MMLILCLLLRLHARDIRHRTQSNLLFDLADARQRFRSARGCAAGRWRSCRARMLGMCFASAIHTHFQTHTACTRATPSFATSTASPRGGSSMFSIPFSNVLGRSLTSADLFPFYDHQCPGSIIEYRVTGVAGRVQGAVLHHQPQKLAGICGRRVGTRAAAQHAAVPALPLVLGHCLSRSYHITSHHITSHHIASHHITSCCGHGGLACDRRRHVLSGAGHDCGGRILPIHRIR